MTQSDLQSPPEAWPRARRAVRVLVTPIQRFLAIEAASGVLLLVATAAALIWANSPASASYHALWHTSVGFSLGSWAVEESLHFVVNDGLMTVFFFVVGLEIRRELHEGELADARRAALPLVAAFGGVMLPAAIYAVLNAGRVGAAGWAVPMATDIAFAVGVLALLGTRVPNACRVLLLGLAVIDDIAAVIVIAVFFSAGLSLAGVGIAAGGIAIVIVVRASGARAPALYIVPGIVVWIGLGRAGIHPTLAGVLLGLLTPARPWFGVAGFKQATAEQLQQIDAGDRHSLLASLGDIERARREAVSPAERLVHVLHPWVAYIVMPVFALANAGVDLGSGELSGDGLWVFLGIVIGLAVGKPLGIAGASVLASRAGVVARSADITRSGLAIVGIVGGIGFTMSLFIAQLAFPPGPLLETAKLAILAGSAVAMLVGLTYGAATLRRRPRPPVTA